jgi:cytochrome b6-f complex iron-sulfur subunit
MKRRDFLNKIAIGTASGVGLIGASAMVAEIIPPSTESFSLLNLGQIEDYPINEFSFIPDKKIYLYRSRSHLRVLSAVCTHLGCTIQKSENGFDCPCHGSHYDKLGTACSGPASRSLDRLKVTVSKERVITVDKKNYVSEDFQLP